MNDFTKEELYKICAIVTTYFGDIDVPSIDKELINKIESMIDNYCEPKIWCDIPLPTIENYCCQLCNEEWAKCECKA